MISLEEKIEGLESKIETVRTSLAGCKAENAKLKEAFLAEINQLESIVLFLWEVAKIYHADQEYLASSKLRYIERFEEAMYKAKQLEEKAND